MSNNKTEIRARLLPTYRWDEWDEEKGRKLSTDEVKLRTSTTKLLLEFLRSSTPDNDGIARPPEGIIIPIAAMNVAKRSSATRRAEALIEKGEIAAPSISLIPTCMASGHEILGVEDTYMSQDHPSQELFAYNRLGKKSWLNKRFGEHCLTAVGFAHPRGIVKPADTPTRVKAHASSRGFYGGLGNRFNDEWVVVSSKTPIATIEENGRRASLISRVTGAVDMTSPGLHQTEVQAIRRLSEHEMVSDQTLADVLGQKALLLEALERHDGTPDNPFYPVLQTVYLTQLDQK